MKIKKYAAIDIGSNAMRLLINNVIDFNGEKTFKKVTIVRVPIRLGTEAFIDKIISKRTIDKFVFAMKAYANLMEAHEVSGFRACATSALREAKNSSEIIQRVRKETGIQIEIISGEEEASIVYSTHIGKLVAKDRAFLYVDVGGGSVELTLFENSQIIATKSFDVGTLRILNNLVSEALWLEVEKWTKSATEGKNVYLIGSGGNINKVFKISRRPKNEPLNISYLQNYLDNLKTLTYEDRVIKLELNLDRADVIIPALTIFTSIMRWSNAEEIYVPKIGLADGLIKMMN